MTGRYGHESGFLSRRRIGRCSHEDVTFETRMFGSAVLCREPFFPEHRGRMVLPRVCFSSNHYRWTSCRLVRLVEQRLLGHDAAFCYTPDQGLTGLTGNLFAYPLSSTQPLGPAAWKTKTARLCAQGCSNTPSINS